MLKTLEERGADLSEILQEMAVKLAIEDNRFQGENGIYSEENRIVGDGTVLTAASSKTQNESVDLETGEIRRHRMDLVSQQHTEGGGTCVYGAKFAAIWSTGANRHDTIAMGAAHVSSPSPQTGPQSVPDLSSKHWKNSSLGVPACLCWLMTGQLDVKSKNC